ncbi:MAG: N-acetylmuramoyl-L-alanine amidase [Planctomycetota bacterium]
MKTNGLPRTLTCFAMLVWLGLAAGCAVKPGTHNQRPDDAIIVGGQLYRIGTPVVTWLDLGGMNAYRVDKQYAPWSEAQWDDFKDDPDMPSYAGPQRYGWRIDRFNNGRADFTEDEINAVRFNWPLETLQDVVDQFVIHYDVCGTSGVCFDVLHDRRFLSVHFMLDVDGTIYQSLDLQERAWHAGTANSRSIGIEITNMGGYPPGGENPFDVWYATDEKGTYVTIPNEDDIRRRQFVPGRYYSARPEPVTGTINGSTLEMYDLTNEQYDALIKLTAALCKIFPKIDNDYPRLPDGSVNPNELSDEEFADFAGLIGHFHETNVKTDPGPAFDWERLRQGVAKELR